MHKVSIKNVILSKWYARIWAKITRLDHIKDIFVNSESDL